MGVKKIPYLGVNGYNKRTLFVEDKPFMVLGGELHNSAASNPEHMEKEVWPYIRELHMNTVILPIAWEEIEPEEGTWEFSLIDELLRQARRENVKIVLLWFGLWKNGESYYVPEWVKRDTVRFFRNRYFGGAISATISPVCQEAIEADSKAFAALMAHLADVDIYDRTVISVQVENEIGFLGGERDFSEQATELYGQNMPIEAENFWKVKGNWKEALGEDAPEFFMAWQYAKAIERIAAAGKKEYPIPMYINAWIEQHPDHPGEYPSGGPVAKLVPFWLKFAPSIDFVAPDIYHPNFKGVCESYLAGGNEYFIPEARRDPITASNVFYAFGGIQAMGYSPFAVEDFCRDNIEAPDEKLLRSLNIDLSGFNCFGTAPFIQKSYEVLEGLLPLIAEKRGSSEMIGFIRATNVERGCTIPLEKFDLQLDYIIEDVGKPGCAGIVFPVEDGFFITGCNVKFTARPKKGSEQNVMTIRLQEGAFIDGEWKPGRILNGDELHDNSIGSMAETKYMKVQVY